MQETMDILHQNIVVMLLKKQVKHVHMYPDFLQKECGHVEFIDQNKTFKRLNVQYVWKVVKMKWCVILLLVITNFIKNA